MYTLGKHSSISPGDAYWYIEQTLSHVKMRLLVFNVVLLVLLGVWSMAKSAPTTVIDDDCVDKKDCSGYDIHSACCGQYEAFSRFNCPRHCRFCTPKVTEAPLCTDTIGNCAQYNSDLCTNSAYDNFVKTKCAGFCKLCEEPVYIPECGRGNGSSSGHGHSGGPAVTVQTTPGTTPTPTMPSDKCVGNDGKYYSKGETWYANSCTQKCECKDFVNNTIECEPISCPKWIHNCDLIHIEGACCPILKCNYFNTVHGPRTILGRK